MAMTLDAKPLPTMTASDIARFWSYVETGPPDICWPWKAGQFAGGYGQLKINRRTVKAHRVAFLLFHGYDPVGLMVRHTCDNPPCCNGLHLIDGTGTDNAADCIARGRNNAARGERHGSRTHPERWPRGERCGGSVLTEQAVIEIRDLYQSGEFTQMELADRFSVKRETIGNVIRGNRWSHIPFDPDALRVVSRHNRVSVGESNGSAKLTDDDVRAIRARYAAGGILQRHLADEFGVSRETVIGILHNKTWTHVR